ncbi:chitinase putative [Entamoeba histolytica]|uniref:Chitinase, putative n=5 Tax=Entamoeba histolytica TaxID=5759 RepID=C4M3K8_ENTH1|nr:chitinase, putative [Entamoeba histolytica HM-1:IMSS]EAL46819.1 chitinase, putative [Entamoeba histolytica HM-1:IMSS]EMD42527.1 chitinase, putative [Entamoeba histolytica KU27]ENY60326.1 chitinase, putative [Entamoeba histolytica HM-1:IMSS-A]GAT95908.1 chitinase putative [Entamoeba histolytica]|eukprot:XP_652205.1 chitinase, putative [Entamoeba histolytica HM-1:IMSS]
MSLLALIYLIYMANAHNCEGLSNGFYCIDNKNYLWCYGRTEGTPGKCIGETVCKCGRTQYNPCVWNFLDLPDCEKKPGDFFEKSPDSSESKHESSEIKPDSSESKHESSEVKPDSSESKHESSEIKPDSSESKHESSEPEVSIPKKTVAYYTNWAQYRFNSIDGWTCKYTADNIDPTIVDVINYAFVVFDSTYTLKEYEWNDDQMIPKIVAMKSRNPNLKVLASIGGWNFNFYDSTKHLYSQMAEKQATRATFIKSAMSFARKYNLDGIDIDWEYPANEDQGGRPVDTQSFTLLLKEFREAIDKEAGNGKSKLLLTIAAPAGPWNIKNIEVSKFHQYIDWINLMTYDLHGSWDAVTGSHTALYATDGISVDDAVTAYLNAGVPSTKIMLGMAHYGRGWTLKSSSDHEMGSAATGASKSGTCTGENGYLSKYEIDALIPQENIKFDSKSKTMYGYKNDQWFSFDTKETFKYKADYLCKKKLGGVMFWSLDLDKNYVNTKYIKSLIEKC